MKLKIKKLHPDAVIPHFANPGDAGLDVYAVSIREAEKYIEYGTGLAFELPENSVLLVYPRSSLSNYDLSMANSVGVLDAGYRGELKFRFRKIGSEIYKIGDRIGQIMLMPLPNVELVEVDELSASQRGEGGFGSSENIYEKQIKNR